MSAIGGDQPGPVIEMCDVAVPAFGDPAQVVVRKVNWSVAPGDYWIVGGLHGTGKSDLLMMTAGLIAPAHGAYRFYTQEMPILEESRLQTRLRLGFVFDGGRVFSRLSVAENVALPLRYHRDMTSAEAAAQAQKVLKLTGLDQFAELNAGVLGRAWQKRVGLARAIILQPDVLLIDNPLSGLDARHAHWWLHFLDAVWAGHEFWGGKPVTLIVTSDTLSPWRGHACQIALLKDKEFVVLGGWDQMTKVAEPELKQVLAELGAIAFEPTHAQAYPPNGGTIAGQGDIGEAKTEY